MTAPHVYAVILAGGSGTRFWPLSRRLAPKQLLSLTSDRTMLQETVLRVMPTVAAERVVVVTNRDLLDETRRQLRSVGITGTVVGEPLGRNTALAIAVTAWQLAEQDPDAVMVVLPADHVITKPEKFRACLELAIGVARAGYLVTMGIVPSRPETGYGYIQRGKAVAIEGVGKVLGESVFSVERFVEKPDRGTAERYVSEGTYLWNSGMFVWRASTILQELERHSPRVFDVGQSVSRAMLAGSDASVRELYDSADSVSIDYAVMERSDRVVVIPTDFGWSDVGSWAALDEVSATDARGNVVMGRVVDVDSRNSIIYAQDRVVAAIGLNDLIVVDTPDATLVCAKDRAQDVRKVVDALEIQQAQEHVVHKTVQRPWGTYTVLGEGPGYKIKRIVVNPESRLSLQMHDRRSEHWVVVSGTARVTCGERVFDVRTNESGFIPPQTKHRLENVDPVTPLEIIEVQNGPYLGEDDIVRFDDDFGRS